MKSKYIRFICPVAIPKVIMLTGLVQFFSKCPNTGNRRKNIRIHFINNKLANIYTLSRCFYVKLSSFE